VKKIKQSITMKCHYITLWLKRRTVGTLWNIKIAWMKRRYLRGLPKAVALLMEIDRFMALQKLPRWRIKQFWRDLIKSPEARAIALERVLESIKRMKRRK